MHVGIVVYALDRPLSGISRYTLEFTRAMAALADRPDITLLAAGHPGPLSELDLKWVSLPGCRRLPGLVSLGNVLLPSIGRRLGLDIIHDPTGIAPFFWMPDTIKTVMTLYDVIPWSFPGYSSRMDTLLYRHWLPRVLPKVDTVITVSKASKTDIMQYMRLPAPKIEVIFGAANPTYRPSEKTRIEAVRTRYQLPEHYILYVGSVEERKNLRRVLQAFEFVQRRGVPHTLVITGVAKWKYADILKAANASELQKNIMFTGYVDEDDLPALYSGADLFVFPSLYEGFGLPVLEAMACGTAVITSNSSSLPEIAGSAALLVDPHSVEAIADAMYHSITEPSLRERLQQEGLQRAAAFTWQRAAKETVQVYERVLRAE
jgi:glycosyltransferase involved in cell wall biosynthesis